MLATHLIFGAYGFWLPNDERGSWSDFAGAWELFRYGPATKTTAIRSVAAQPHNRERRLAAKQALRRSAVEFTGVQARAVGRGFAHYAHASGLKVFACAILPDHIDLVVAAHRISPGRLVIQLKGEASTQLVAENLHPFQHLTTDSERPPKCFARGQWQVYLDSLEDVHRAVRYVEGNPQKEGKPRQRWSFVTPFER